MTERPLRIAPVPPADRDERLVELLAGLGVPGDEPADAGSPTTGRNIFATLAHHPRLLKRWAAFGGVLLFGGALPARERELLILRTGWNCRSEYEWGQHVPIGLGAGLTPDEITAITDPDAPGSPAWSADDAALLRAADELHATNTIGDDTWAALAARWDTQQLIEVCMVIGQYHLVAFTLNALGVQLEAGVGGFPS